MPRVDVDYEHEIDSGDYGYIGDERYACPPGYLNNQGNPPIVYLDRPASQNWEVTEHDSGVFSVLPQIRLGDRVFSLRVWLRNGQWTSLPLQD